MLKPLLCLTWIALVATLLLELRQEQLDLNFQTNQLHNQIEAKQAELWNQQLQIAICTAPNAIARTVDNQQIKFVSPTPIVPGQKPTGQPQDPSDTAE
jgi:cell division protein FtsL